MKKMLSRAHFELYAASAALPLQKSACKKVDYADPQTEAAWRGWQAAMERIVDHQTEALLAAREALDYYAHMFPGIEVRDGGDKAAEALSVINDLVPAIDQ